MEYVGLDLHKEERQICLLTETGEVAERRIRTEPQTAPPPFDSPLVGLPRGERWRRSLLRGCVSSRSGEIRVQGPNAGRADPVGEFRLRACTDVAFDSFPLPVAVPDALAGRADRE